MVDHLLLLGFAVGPKRVRRLMRKMCITAIYPRRSLSKGGVAKFRMPYLLRGLSITRPHQGIGHQLPIKRYRQTA